MFLALSPACGEKHSLGELSATEGTGPTTEGTEPTTVSTGPATATDSTATDSTATSGGFPAGCETPDPAVAGEFELKLVGWPDQVPLEDPGVVCTVDSVTPEAGTVTTALVCEVDGASLPATVVISAAPEGPVVWTAGDSVRLRYRFYEDADPGMLYHLQLRDADDDSVLMFASDSEYDESVPHDIAPLTFGIDTICAEETDTFLHPTLLRFGLPEDGGEVGVLHRHRGALPIDASDHYIIDVTNAQGTTLHGDERVAFLLRRVHVGG